MGVVERWIEDNEDSGDYAAFVGFEADVAADDGLAALYAEMSIVEKASLFAFVCGLIDEERKTPIPDDPPRPMG
jgi:hypothetical protein